MKKENMKTGDMYIYIDESDKYFTKNKEYPVSRVLNNEISIIDDRGNNHYFTKDGGFDKWFKPVQKYMCAMGLSDREKYYNAVDDSLHLMRNDNLNCGVVIQSIELLLENGYQLITSEDFMKKFPPPSKEVEFVKGEKYGNSNNIIILCTGSGERADKFSGVVININKYENKGTYSETWAKKSFKPLIKRVKAV